MAVLVSRYVSLGSILAALSLPVAVALTPQRAEESLLIFSVVLATLVVWAHRGNLVRLVQGRENRFGAHRSPGDEAIEREGR